MKPRMMSKVYTICLLLIAMGTTQSMATEKSLMQLKNCPDSPNCVSSQSTDQSHRVSPIAFQGDPQQTLVTLKQLILAMPRTRVLEQNESYLHIEFRSRLFDFSDDVEVFVDAAEQVIHIRSASRTGYWDFGANRKRVQRIRAGFHNMIASK
jgi:uncharacterized protein (DUF1499 family)